MPDRSADLTAGRWLGPRRLGTGLGARPTAHKGGPSRPIAGTRPRCPAPPPLLPGAGRCWWGRIRFRSRSGRRRAVGRARTRPVGAGGPLRRILAGFRGRRGYGPHEPVSDTSPEPASQGSELARPTAWRRARFGPSSSNLEVCASSQQVEIWDRMGSVVAAGATGWGMPRAACGAGWPARASRSTSA